MTSGLVGISVPFNFQQQVHVDINYNWSGDAEENFIIEEKLGEGYRFFCSLKQRIRIWTNNCGYAG